MGAWPTRQLPLKISNTMVHQRINRLMEQGIQNKAYHKRKENRL
jgi:hypothetical protein